MRAQRVTVKLDGTAEITPPVRALRWTGVTVDGFATFTVDGGQRVALTLPDDGAVYPLTVDHRLKVSGLVPGETFWYAVADNEEEAAYLRPVESRIVQLGDDVRVLEDGRVRVTETNVQRIIE